MHSDDLSRSKPPLPSNPSPSSQPSAGAPGQNSTATAPLPPANILTNAQQQSSGSLSITSNVSTASTLPPPPMSTSSSSTVVVGGSAAVAISGGGAPVPAIVGSGGGASGSPPSASVFPALPSSHQGGASFDTSESVLPREFRTRLHKLFIQIEREYEREYRKLYAENIALQERLEKYEDGDHPETNFLAKKSSSFKSGTQKQVGASQISQRIKLQYKQSTSRLVSSLRPTPSTVAGGGWQLGCRITGHKDGVWEVTTHRKLVGSASADGTVRLWANGTANCLLQYVGHSGSVNSVRFRDDLMLTASGDGCAHLVSLPVDLQTVAGLSLGTGTEGAGGGAGIPDVGGVGAPGIVLSPSTSGGSIMAQQTVNNGANDEEDAVLQDGDTFSDECAAILRVPHSVFSCLSSTADSNTTAALSAADFLGPDQIVTAGWDRLGRIYDLQTRQEVSTLSGHDGQLTDVRSAPGGQKMALTSAKDGTFRLWDFRKSGLQVHLQQGHSQTVSTAQFIGEQTEKLVSGGTDRVCKVWDIRQWRAPLVTIRTDASINRLAVHPAGQILALPLDNRNVKFFDLQGNRLGRLPRSSSQGHSRMVSSVCWSDEGKNNFLSAGFDHQVLGWIIHFPISS